MFPGVILQMTYWYRPDEMSIRLLYFCEVHRLQARYPAKTDKTFPDALGNFSTVISGVLAFAFDTISGRCGLSGWQW